MVASPPNGAEPVAVDAGADVEVVLEACRASSKSRSESRPACDAGVAASRDRSNCAS